MLNLVIGRTGYGKTEYVFKKLKEHILNGEENILLLTPEQFSFISERRLLLDFNETDVSKIENSNFSKLYHEVSKVYGGNSLPILSDGGKAIMMKRAIDSVFDKLAIFKKYKESSGFIKSMISISDELSSCSIGGDSLLEIGSQLDNKILSDKIFDIALINSAYKSLIENNYFDSADNLTRLYEKVLGTDYFSNRVIFIDGFTGFVQEEFKIIEEMLKNGKDVYITICTDSIADNENGFGLFSHNKETLKDIIDVANKNAIKIKKIELNENFRSKTETLKKLELNLYSNHFEVAKSDNSIEVFKAKDITDECNYVSRNIKKLLREGFCRAREISVITRDSSVYNAELLDSFNRFELPFFDDQRQSLLSQPLIVFIEYLFRIVIYSFKTEDILSLVKTGLLNIDVEKISNLENYVLTWGINGSRWFNNFENSPRGFASELRESDEKLLKEINETRKKIIQPIVSFKNNINEKTAVEISESVYNLLVEIKADKVLKNIAYNLENQGLFVLAEQQGRVWDSLMEILNQMAITLENCPVSIKEYAKLFSIVVESEDIGIIPQGLDNVQFGEADRIRLNNPKVTFILGASEGDFPKVVSSGGMLTEKDREELFSPLSKMNAKLYSFGENLIVQEKYFAYMACCSPSERLFVSYPLNVSSKEKSPSYIISRIVSIFPNIKILESNSNVDLNLLEGEYQAVQLLADNFKENTKEIQSLKEYFKMNNDNSKHKFVNRLNDYSNNESLAIKNKDIAEKLFKKDMFLSASSIETYFNCPFRYFCRYGLSAKPRQYAQLDPMQTGTMIHFVLENIVKTLGSKALSKCSNTEIRLKVKEILNEYFDNNLGKTDEFSNRLSYQFLRLLNLITNVVIRIAEEFSQSDFEARAFELGIDVDGEVTPPIIELKDGGSIKIRGSVDRVDTYSHDDKNYLRVVDYKSGKKKFELSDIIYGLNLQMFLYLFAICSDETSKYSGIPAGVLYMHSARSIKDVENRKEKENFISKKTDDDYKMQGIVLDDSIVISAMDREISGKFVPVKVDKNGEIKGNLVTIDEMELLSKEIRNIIQKMGEELHKGEINPYPICYKNQSSACEYCDYFSICVYQNDIQEREVNSLKNDELFNYLENGETNEQKKLDN